MPPRAPEGGGDARGGSHLRREKKMRARHHDGRHARNLIAADHIEILLGNHPARAVRVHDARPRLRRCRRLREHGRRHADTTPARATTTRPRGEVMPQVAGDNATSGTRGGR